MKNKTHELKTWPEYFNLVFYGHKTFEIRKNDRGFKSGDKLLLREWDPQTEKYTGADITVEVTYIIYGGVFGIEEGYCVMSIK